MIQKITKIHEKSVLVAIKVETRKRTQKNIEQQWNMLKMDLKMGARTRSFFGHLPFFFCASRPWEPKWLLSLPQEPPRPIQASISVYFWLILDDFLMIFCIMWAIFYLVCLITFLITSSFHFQTHVKLAAP